MDNSDKEYAKVQLSATGERSDRAARLMQAEPRCRCPGRVAEPSGWEIFHMFRGPVMDASIYY